MNNPSRQDTAGATYLNLQKLARATGRPTDELLLLYALEGFLDRLSQSVHREQLILKGGVLLASFDIRRPTRDIDFAANQPLGDGESLRQALIDILRIDSKDGLNFDAEQIAVAPIRSNDQYPGLRARVLGRLSRAKIHFHIDINLGDPIVPPAEVSSLPRLLGGDPITLKGYTRELVLAEKIVTAISRGVANTRWRDFVDIAALADQPIDVDTLRSSIARVASYRHTAIVPLAEALDGFGEIAQPRWAAWRTKQRLDHQPEQFKDLLADVIAFTDPILNEVT